MNQVNTQWETTAIYTTNFRDCKELYQYEIFPDEYDFYTDDENIRKKFESKFFNFYYMNDLAWDQLSIWKHYFKNHMEIENIRYKNMFEMKMQELELNNVDIKEIIQRINEGEGTSENTTDSESTGVNENDSNVRDYDTPQGRINPANLDGHISGLTSTDNTQNSSSTGKSKGSSFNTAINQEDTERHLKGYQGSKTISELKHELLNVIINIDKEIIKDCKKLFLNVW